MAILVDETSRVLVQGITGREGKLRTRLMLDYGTQIVAGVTPGRGGQAVHGVPVYDTVKEAWASRGPFDISVVFVPAPMARDAALEAIDASVKLTVLIPDRVPLYDVLELAEVSSECGAHFIGPNTVGLVSPGRSLLGMMGGRVETAHEYYFQGPVGVMSRSGGITSAVAYTLTQSGVGQSTAVHVGGDPIVGLGFSELLPLFQADNQTQVVVMYGEIGTTQEERAAQLVASGKFSKPLICFIGGATAREGTRFSHAGAIVESGKGRHADKVACLREAGAHIVSSVEEIPPLVRTLLQSTDT